MCIFFYNPSTHRIVISQNVQWGEWKSPNTGFIEDFHQEIIPIPEETVEDQDKEEDNVYHEGEESVEVLGERTNYMSIVSIDDSEDEDGSDDVFVED